MKSNNTLLVCFLFLSTLINTPAYALKINIDYSYDTGFFSEQKYRDRLQQAVSYYASFSDTLLGINTGNDPSQENSWTVYFNNPSNLASGLVSQKDLKVEDNAITIFVGGAPMGAGVLGYGTTGILSEVTGSAEFINTVYTRGQENAQGSTATDYGVWGGAIAFNSDVNWHNEATIATLDSTKNDFLTTAIHEIGHVLGYGTADSWFNYISTQNGESYFTGGASVLSYGSLIPVFDNAHWAEGVTSYVHGIQQETLMDPSTPAGTRQLLTELDYAGLKDIGWQLTPVPVPPAILLFLSGLAMVSFPRISSRMSVKK